MGRWLAWVAGNVMMIGGAAIFGWQASGHGAQSLVYAMSGLAVSAGFSVLLGLYVIRKTR